MVTPFADAEYFTENFGSPPPLIADRLDAELARASRFVRNECEGIDARIAVYVLDPSAPGAVDPLIAADVVCEMVRTAAAGASGGIGVASTQVGAGPYQETLNYSNPVGDLYLSKKHRRQLKCGGQQAFTVSMASPAPVDPIGWIDRGWE